MKGQWIGRYAGTNTGLMIVNADEQPWGFRGVAYANDDNGQLPSLVVAFTVQSKDKEFTFRSDFISPVNPSTGSIDTWENVKGRYGDDVAIPTYVDAKGSWSDTHLQFEWTTNIGTNGTATLPASQAGNPSNLVPLGEVTNWATFKNYVTGLEGRRHLFRGQHRPWRLRTAYHRLGRADLGRFLAEDIPQLHRHLSARTRHVFNLEIPDQNGAFFSLVQHHGYPTPLLDWTYSPYVAELFAYRGISNREAQRATPADKVRLFVFDQSTWRSDWRQLNNLIVATPHVSIGEYLGIENERMIPQQAASTVTNIDDVESYIATKQTRGNVYLWAIDLPVSERSAVIRELSYMGITAGSLFPGLDGACEELRQRNFDI